MNRIELLGHGRQGRLLHIASVCLALASIGCDPVFEEGWEEEGVAIEGLSRCAGGVNGQPDYCSASCTCDAAMGDCDSNAECSAGNICGVNNGARYGAPFTQDYCAPPHCFNGVIDGGETGLDCGSPECGTCTCATGSNGDGSFCTVSCPCSAGEGDCDSDAECDPGLSCVNDVGADYGQAPTNDVCVSATCSDGTQNGGETGVDCGGTCSPCASTTAEYVSVTSAEALGGGRATLYFGTSADGRYVVYGSEASDLVAGDTNGVQDIFLRDRVLGTTTRVSVGVSGAQSNGLSHFASISDDGRYVAFVSAATNLVTNDTNGREDVFVRDMVTASNRRVSVGPSLAQLNGDAEYARISGNGRYVVYSSSATNIVAGDTNALADVFVADRITLANVRVSLGPAAVQGDGLSERPTISADGRYVAFQSRATNFTTTDTNANYDVFVRDRTTNTTTLVSASTAAATTAGNNGSIFPVISGDGTAVAFRSIANNLIAGDTNGTYDIFVRVLATTTTERVSVATAGTQANATSVECWISSNGSIVAFATNATNLGGDTNGATSDIYIRNRTTSTTTLAFGGDGGSAHPVLSSDGHLVVFRTAATNVAPPVVDANGQLDLAAVPL